MEKLMALYGISSPSGREGKMAKFIIEELKKMEIPFRQDRYGNIYAVNGNRKRRTYRHGCCLCIPPPPVRRRHISPSCNPPGISGRSRCRSCHPHRFRSSVYACDHSRQSSSPPQDGLHKSLSCAGVPHPCAPRHRGSFSGCL